MGRLFKYLKSFLRNICVMRVDGVRISPLSYCDEMCKFEKNIYIDRFCNLHKVEIGAYSYIGYGSFVSNCKIGRFCSIGPDVKIGLGLHPTHMVSTSPVFYSNQNCLGTKWTKTQLFEESLQTEIGNDVWIGANAIIIGGVKIGDGAIIAAGAVVTKDVEAYSIVGGVPAKTIRKRIPEETADQISKIQWWKWDEETLKSRVEDFVNPVQFIEKYRESSD